VYSFSHSIHHYSPWLFGKSFVVQLGLKYYYKFLAGRDRLSPHCYLQVLTGYLASSSHEWMKTWASSVPLSNHSVHSKLLKMFHCPGRKLPTLLLPAFGVSFHDIYNAIYNHLLIQKISQRFFPLIFKENGF
jgi:hypothetical protein